MTNEKPYNSLRDYDQELINSTKKHNEKHIAYSLLIALGMLATCGAIIYVVQLVGGVNTI